jgi:type IV pilus assembly protein PilW
MAIGLAILAVLGTVFSRTSSGRGDLERVTRLVENSRFAADIIGEDVRHAGFYGSFMPPADTVYKDVSPCTWDTANVSKLGWEPKAVSPVYPAPLQGWDDPGAGVAELDCLLNRVPGTDVLAIRRVSSVDIQPDQTVPTSVYVQKSRCIAEPNYPLPPGGLVVSNAVAAFTLTRASCKPSELAPVRRYFVRVYYIASCNDCSGGGDGIPTLKRFEVVNNSSQIVSLAEGVGDLQFEYAFDTVDDDGAPEQMLTKTDATGPTASWANVVAVRMHALMRSSEPGLSSDTTPTKFNLGTGHPEVDCPDRYRCRLVTSTFRLNNVAGRREK